MIYKHLENDLTRVIRAWASLSMQEQDVLIQRYGLGRTQQQVGHQYRVTKERIRQVEDSGLSRLKISLIMKED